MLGTYHDTQYYLDNDNTILMVSHKWRSMKAHNLKATCQAFRHHTECGNMTLTREGKIFVKSQCLDKTPIDYAALSAIVEIESNHGTLNLMENENVGS
jgi:hypothetical protein